MLNVIVAFLTGAMVGGFTFLLIAWSAKRFMNSLYPIVIAAIPITGSFGSILVNKQDFGPDLMLANILGFLCATITLIAIVYISGRKYGLGITDILFGVAKEMLTKMRELDKRQGELTEQSQKLLEREREADRKKRETNAKFKQASEMEENAVRNGRHFMNLVAENEVPIRPGNINQCSRFHQQVVASMNLLSQSTAYWTEIVKAALDNGGKKNPEQSIYINSCAFLSDLSMNLNKHLLRGSGTRVCIRLLGFDGKYHSLVSHYGDEEATYASPISPMPYEGSLIGFSDENGGKPVIYSLNSNNGIAPKGRWDDFMTIAFPEPTKNGRPMLSLTISVEDGNAYIDLLKFLCHTRFDVILRKTTEPFFNLLLEKYGNNIDGAIMLATGDN